MPAEVADVPLAPLTTLRVGGPARRLLEPPDEATLVETIRDLDRRGEPVLVLAGGSNVVITDEGFPGTVVRVVTRGITEEPGPDGRVRLHVQAGEPWEPLVARAVAERLAGFEALSGIPGSTGATPIQNVGAYGQEVSDTIAAVRVLDRATGEVTDLPPAACGFGYRTSVFRGRDRHVVLAVAFDLERTDASLPIRYAELARALGVEAGARAPLAEVREAVLRLRRGKGMVVDPADPDSVSAGSFFTNPILTLDGYRALARRVAGHLGPEHPPPPRFPGPDAATVKTSAAWLIERAGFAKGDGDGRVGLSSKHTLALVNRGGATTAELLGFAREVAAGVQAAFGVALRPEPVLVGCAWEDPGS